MVLVLAGCGTSSEQGSEAATIFRMRTCDEQTARLIGRLYYLTNPINEQTNPQALEAFVQSNSQLLSRGSSWVDCARRVGNQSISRAIQSFSSEDADHAYESSLEMGATMEQAQDVAGSMNQGSIDIMMMGEELLWLAEVIPDAAVGNWNSYNTTGTQLRQQIRQLWPLYQGVMAMDPSMRNILEQTMQQFQPWIEYQMAALVLLMGD